MHTLTVGQSQSGKSLFCKSLCVVLADCGVNVGVFDPLSYGSKSWSGAAFVTNDRATFLRRFYNNMRTVWIIDEARTGLQPRDIALFTQGRHWGHSLVMIGQRATMLNKTMREQCSALIAFSQGQEDAKDLAEDYGDSSLREVGNNWPRLHFRRCVRSYPEHAGKGVLFQPSGIDLVTSTASLILEDAPEPTEELMEASGAAYHKVNPAFLVARKYIAPEDVW
jgi:hypothetical protein